MGEMELSYGYNEDTNEYGIFIGPKVVCHGDFKRCLGFIGAMIREGKNVEYWQRLASMMRVDRYNKLSRGIL